jgi:hypothetical protein
MTIKHGHYIEDSNLSRAWGRAVRPMMQPGGPSEIAPLVVSIVTAETGHVDEDPNLRAALDALLRGRNKGQDCHTVANTIFPSSLWNRTAPRSLLFERYAASLPRIKAATRANQHGLYFQRLIEGGPPDHPNQLEFIINQYNSRTGVRRSALQVSVFDPKLDHTLAPRRGFPCLQHVTFAPVAGKLNVNAFYATQFAVERAYGNYIGLCRLGEFVAHELGLTLGRMTCFTGIMQLGDRITAATKQKLSTAIDTMLGEQEQTQ